MFTPSARVVCDSVYEGGPRLTTIEGDIHRFVLAELNTHRVFSRNSASSRAIPFTKQVKRVVEGDVYPVVWAGEQKGMQGGEEIEKPDDARYFWEKARGRAVDNAKNLADLGVHKSIANRLLEPFAQHTVVISSTAWDNFFGLRCNPMAQPEIRVFAEAVEAAMADSKPTELEQGEWHLPYIQDDERDDMPSDVAVKVSAARCARVSYLTQNGVRDFEQDVQLYDRLTSAWPMHASPLEHVARPCPGNMHDVNIGTRDEPFYVELPKYGNFLGWRQHRFDVEASKQYQAFG